MFYRFLMRLPLSDNGRVFVGLSICMGICSLPLLYKTQQGHDLFSQQKPEAILKAEDELRRKSVPNKE